MEINIPTKISGGGCFFIIVITGLIIALIYVSTRCFTIGNLYRGGPYHQSQNKSEYPDMDKFRFESRTDCEEFFKK